MDTSASNLTNQLNGINTVIGIKYYPYYFDASSSRIVFVIGYVLKGSPGEKAGLKRGDVIMKVDGQIITATNYSSILQNQTLRFEIGAFSNNAFTSNNSFVDITKAIVQTNPIQKDTVVLWGGKKVGYLCYLQFLTSFDDSLRSVFGRFKNYKSTGIDELVLDLRFNGGGYVSSSDLLSCLSVKDLASKVGTTMNKKVYNNTYTNELKANNNPKDFITTFTNEANNISNLNRIFILTSNNTASASELVINNLKPFMQVILIGEHTYGKNVGSFTITDSKGRWTFGLQPITFKTTNALDQSDYGTVNGFTPDYTLSDNTLPFKALGDPYETYFNRALTIISPVAFVPFGITQGQGKAVLFKNMPIADNPILDAKEMWIPRNK
jgi:C-terminal processing protease CtpA/Prc